MSARPEGYDSSETHRLTALQVRRRMDCAFENTGISGTTSLVDVSNDWPLIPTAQIHVDEYKMLMFRSLVSKHSDSQFAHQSHLVPEAPGLVGFMCANTYHPGCLTLDETVRLHSCEKGNYCRTVQRSPVVWIRPIITRLPAGQVVAEVGVGGGGDDLEREAELDYLSPADTEFVLQM